MSKLPAVEAKLVVSSAKASAPAADADVVAVFQETAGKDKKAMAPNGVYASVVERFRSGSAFNGAHGAVQFVRFGGKGSAESCLFVGMGAPAELTEEKARAAGGHVFTKLKAEKVGTAVIDADSLFGVKGIKAELTHVALVRAFAEGLLLGAYEFTKHKSKPAQAEKTAAPAKLVILTHEKSLKDQLDRELPRVVAEAEAMAVTRDWSNEPSNHGTPEYFAAEARRLSRQYGLKCTILTERDAAAEKMGLFLGVGQGAEREGRIVVLEYTPKGARKASKPKTIALVGKGITFDSGGISLKPSARMEEMKHDMTGAATVMGAILLAARWQVPNRVVAIMAFTENMPDGNAIQPGCVLTSRAGKTVEVINTDAEGRLILADVLDYAHEFKPDAIIDAATLTGAVGVALGKHAGAALGNDDLLVDAVRRAGEQTGERLWQLPLFDEYFEDMKSDTADMRNSCNDSNGGVIRGAIFLKQFIQKGMPWVHLDIATTCYNMAHLPYMPKKGASGTYVRTLARFAADF